jgi:hypothetical protein
MTGYHVYFWQCQRCWRRWGRWTVRDEKWIESIKRGGITDV